MDKDIAISLGKAARQARKALGLTQANMAERLELSVEFYGRMERGVSLPSIETLVCMVEILGVGADVLLDIEALRTKMAASATRTALAEPPGLRELLSMLSNARPATLRIVRLLLDELEPMSVPRKRCRGSSTRPARLKDE